MENSELYKTLEALAMQMQDVAAKLNQYSETDPEAMKHSMELMAASMQVWNWAAHLEGQT